MADELRPMHPEAKKEYREHLHDLGALSSRDEGMTLDQKLCYFIYRVLSDVGGVDYERANDLANDRVRRGLTPSTDVGEAWTWLRKDIAFSLAPRDTERLDWLDAANRPFGMGWRVSLAPVGNVSVGTIIELGKEPTPIRAAIDAAMSASRSEAPPQ